ncbi:MAG: hypothetical protein ABW148_13005 [Sedimenticola sp.]
MRQLISLILILLLPLPVVASHGLAGFDICEVNRDTLPPGLTIEMLPKPKSSGAALLQQYCTQCHNLPGPDRHTAAEWRDVTSNMFLLMDVSHRFGGLMGKVEIMSKEEQGVVLAYLEQHAVNTVDQIDLTTAPSQSRKSSIWVLLPLLLLVSLGLFRWWRHLLSNRKPCVID